MRAYSRLVARQSKVFIERQKTRKMVMAGLVSAVMFFWAFAIFSFFNLDRLLITEVRVYGADEKIENSIRAAAMDAIKGDYFGLLPRANAVLLDEGKVAKAVASSSPKVNTVTVRKEKGGVLAISVGEKVPIAIICPRLPDSIDGAINLEGEENCYFADKEGLLFDDAMSFSGGVYPRYYFPDMQIDGSSLVGTYATSTSEYEMLKDIFGEIERGGIDLLAVLMKENGEFEFYARNPSVTKETVQSQFVIYLNKTKSVNVQVENLLSFWSTMIEEARSKGQNPVFEYIDVRYEPNVFFRKVE